VICQLKGSLQLWISKGPSPFKKPPRETGEKDWCYSYATVLIFDDGCRFSPREEEGERDVT